MVPIEITSRKMNYIKYLNLIFATFQWGCHGTYGTPWIRHCSRRFNLETNHYQLQCFGFAAILVYPTPRCTDWAIIVQFGFSKMAAKWRHLTSFASTRQF